MKEIKTPQELGISNHEWVSLAESLLISRQWVSVLPYGELAVIHQMRVKYLEDYFGITEPIDIGVQYANVDEVVEK